MAWANLISAVEAVITANGNNEITGTVLKDLLVSNIIPQLGASSFKGIAEVSTDPGTPQSDVFYIANGLGTYTNFGSLEVTKTVTFLQYVSGSWMKKELNIVEDIVNDAIEKDLFYLVKPSDADADERTRFVSIKDAVFDTAGTAYENYEFAMLYIGKNDPSFGSMMWVRRRANSSVAWENYTIYSGANVFQVENKWLEVTKTWDGVAMKFLIDTTVMADNYVTFDGLPFVHKAEYTNADYLQEQAMALKLDKTEHIDFKNELKYKTQKTNNYTEEYGGTSFSKLSYLSGRDASTDFDVNIDAPMTAGFLTKATKVVLQPNENAFVIASFKQLMYELMASYETTDGTGMYPVYFTAKYYNSSTDTSVTLHHGIRTKINGDWYLPKTIITIPPQEVKTVTVEINPEEVTWQDFDGGIFDAYDRMICGAGTETEIYIGEAEVYFKDPKKRVSAQIVNGENIKDDSIGSEKLKEGVLSLVSTRLPSKQNIAVAGSSITWKSGDLNGGYAGKVLDYLRKELANYVGVNDITSTGTDFANTKLYGGVGKQITGLNSTVSFQITGDELAICQAIKRTTDFAKLEVRADGVVIGSFDNVNKTLGSNTQNFTGNGIDIKFELEHPFTYNHVITVNRVAQTVQIYSGGGSYPSGVDVLVIRKNVNGDPRHILWFANAPTNGHAVAVSYDYGQLVCHERSTVGQVGNDNTNESNYGDGTVSFDPAAPSSLSSGQEFRSGNKDAFFIHKFTSSATRNITIEIVGGTNPYFIFNFAVNRYHNFINAGIGGWTINAFKDENSINDYYNIFNHFIPSVILTEFATNDDWNNGARRVTRAVANMTEQQVKDLHTLEVSSIVYDNPNYTVNFASGIIDEVTRLSITSSHAANSGIQVGDIVRIGNYYGDNKQVVTRKVKSFNVSLGKINFYEPLIPSEILNINTLNDLVGKEFTVRDLSSYKNQYQDLINKIRAISGAMRILIVNPGLSNYFTRQLWGYDIVHRDLANENYNVGVVEVTDELQDFQQSHITGASFEEVTADGSTTYALAKTGHWQGFKVWVNGKNVYGKDCYIKSGQGYKVNQSNTGADLAVGAYSREQTVTEAMELVFTQNAPSSGTVRVEYADVVWSGDYAHTNDNGDYVYAQKYITAIKENIN